MSMKFYSPYMILKEDADYNIIYGERSNGKTTAIQSLGLFGYHEKGVDINGYLDDGSQMAIVRRWEEDYKGKNGTNMFSGIINLGWLEKKTKGRWNNIIYFSQRWYLARFNSTGEKEEQDEIPFAYGFSITSEEHYKSTSYPCIRNILFDEFITRSYYIPDEFVKFQNLLSTIIRQRNDVKIFMCGNTVNKYCPYFNEMGLTNAKTQEQGTIDVYKYGNSSLKVAVEYCKPLNKSKPSDKYFAFNNPKLQMITSGSWEIDIYPHLPVKYNEKDVCAKFFIDFNEELLQCEIIYSKEIKSDFIFIHRKTSPIKEELEELVYTTKIDARYNYRRNIFRPTNKFEKRIVDYFLKEKIFYSTNEIGEIVRNYLIWCKKEKS